jgi:hypothetical protein
MTGPDPAAIEAALRAVPGVAGAEVHPEPGGPGVLRLTLGPDADEAAVAAAVAQILRRDFELSVDAAGVRPATDAPPSRGRHAKPESGSHLRLVHDDVPPSGSQPPPAHATAPATSSRIRIDRFGVTTAGLDVTAEVVLSGPAGPATGAATCPATPTGVLRAAAEATCDAVGRLGHVRVGLEQVMESVAGADRYVLVDLVMLTEGSQVALVGAARVRDDARQAAVRAVLAAVNRRMDTVFS